MATVTITVECLSAQKKFFFTVRSELKFRIQQLESEYAIYVLCLNDKSEFLALLFAD